MLLSPRAFWGLCPRHCRCCRWRRCRRWRWRWRWRWRHNCVHISVYIFSSFSLLLSWHSISVRVAFLIMLCVSSPLASASASFCPPPPLPTQRPPLCAQLSLSRTVRSYACSVLVCLVLVSVRWGYLFVCFLEVTFLVALLGGYEENISACFSYPPNLPPCPWPVFVSVCVAVGAVCKWPNSSNSRNRKILFERIKIYTQLFSYCHVLFTRLRHSGAKKGNGG